MLDRIAAAPGAGVRGWGYDEALGSPPLDRDVLDAVVADRPVVIHHRTGHAALLNSAAIAEFDVSADDGWVADAMGLSTGLGGLTEAVADVSAEMSEAGVTSITDATHTNDATALLMLDSLVGSGVVEQDLSAMVGAAFVAEVPELEHITVTHAKVMPGSGGAVEQLVEAVHDAGYAAAVHCVDVDELEEALQVLGRGDRIEHCGLALRRQVDRIAAIGAEVVTQPSFLLHRGAKYRAELSPIEHDWLYRVRSLLDAGIRVRFSSDSPVVPSNPAEWIEAAVTRCGFPMSEAVDEATAVELCQV